MPSKESLNLFLSKDVNDLKKIRIPGLTKSFEEMTIAELVNFRNPGQVQDAYEVNALSDNISATTSKILNQLGRIKAEAVMKQELMNHNLKQVDKKIDSRINRKFDKPTT